MVQKIPSVRSSLFTLNFPLSNQQHREEEEILSRYESKGDSAPAEHVHQNGASAQTSQDSRDPRLAGWEFKIVRASRNLFRDPAIFQQLCEEEAQAGWILLEKFDDQRVRFKRPIALRGLMKQEYMAYDPYRCYYELPSTPLKKLVPLAAVLAAIVPAYLGYALMTGMLANSKNSSPPPPPPRLSFPPK